MARGKGTGKKSGSKPTTKKRSHKQDTKERYTKAREDAQLIGLIPTTPEAAISSERVDPATQSDAPLPDLIAKSIRNGWAVPEHRKPDLVDELIKILDDPESPTKVKVAAFNALRLADQQQYERDHPEQVAKLKGTGSNVAVSVTVQNNQDKAAVIRGMIERGEIGILEELRTPDITSTSSSSGQQQEMETSTTSESNQQCFSKGVDDT